MTRDTIQSSPQIIWSFTISTPPWQVSGSYFESCNCDPICPCRFVGDTPGGQSTHGICFGTLSWLIERGSYGSQELSGLATAMSLRFHDRTLPSTPWEVVLYVDERGDAAQQEALATIFLGRGGGTPLQNFATAIGTVIAIRPAHIELNHGDNGQSIDVEDVIKVRASHPFHSDEPVMCGIPGFDHPGQEVVTEVLQSKEPALSWDLEDVCGFAARFDYRSDPH